MYCRYKFYYMLAFLGLTVTMSCKPDPEPEPEPEMPCSVSFSPKINAMATRVTDTSFEEGDKISVYACYDESLSSDNYAQNVKYTYYDGLFEAASPIKYPAKDAALTFYALYPYGNYSTPDILFTVSTDQSSEYDYAGSDLMTASAVAKDKDIVDLKFSHRLSKVVLNLVDVPSGSQSVTFCRLYTSVEADITENDYRESGSRYNVKACQNGSNSFKVILPPQKVSAGTLFAEIMVGDKVYEWAVETDIYLSSGIEHSYTARLKGNKVTVSAEINDWDKESGEVEADKE